MFNESYIQYTFEHRLAFRFVVETILEDDEDYDVMVARAEAHDLDKVLLYTLIPKYVASDYHRRTSTHHPQENNKVFKDRYDLLEAVIDFECASYTKADKPLNAYDTIMKYTYTHKEELLKIVESLGIAKSYQNTPNDETWVAFKSSFSPISEQDVHYTIYKWMLSNPGRASEVLKFAQSVISDQHL